VLNWGWKHDSLQIMIFVYICSTWSVDELKTRFETWITRNDVNGVNLVHLSYLITPMACLSSQRSPIVKIKYFMLDCSIYILFVLNTGWKRDSIQMLIFVKVCTTWRLVQLKTTFETSITRNDIYGLSLFHLSYLITLKAYLCSQRTPNFQIRFFIYAWSIYRQFVLNRGWKPDSFQIMILGYVCSTCSVVELITRFETWKGRNLSNGVSLFHLSYLITLKAYVCSL
jgi:hypothetical protein